MMKISAGTCATFVTGVSCRKKKNPGRLTDKYREEKFDVASLFFFPKPRITFHKSVERDTN